MRKYPNEGKLDNIIQHKIQLKASKSTTSALTNEDWRTYVDASLVSVSPYVTTELMCKQKTSNTSPLSFSAPWEMVFLKQDPQSHFHIHTIQHRMLHRAFKFKHEEKTISLEGFSRGKPQVDLYIFTLHFTKNANLLTIEIVLAEPFCNWERSCGFWSYLITLIGFLTVVLQSKTIRNREDGNFSIWPVVLAEKDYQMDTDRGDADWIENQKVPT